MPPPDLHDPYHLDAAGIREPPSGWRRSFTHLGPGLVLSASIVGSGELIATTTARRAGRLHAALAGALQLRRAKWPSRSSRPVDHCDRLAGPVRLQSRAAALRASRVGQPPVLPAGDLEGAPGGRRRGGAPRLPSACCFPSAATPWLDPSRTIWHVIVVVVTIASLYSSRYTLIEKGCGMAGRHLLAGHRRGSPSACRSLLGRHARRPDERAHLPAAAGGARRGDRHVRDHRGRGRRDHHVQLLVHREGLCPVGWSERRERGVGLAARAAGSL